MEIKYEVSINLILCLLRFMLQATFGLNEKNYDKYVSRYGDL